MFRISLVLGLMVQAGFLYGAPPSAHYHGVRPSGIGGVHPGSYSGIRPGGYSGIRPGSYTNGGVGGHYFQGNTGGHYFQGNTGGHYFQGNTGGHYYQAPMPRYYGVRNYSGYTGGYGGLSFYVSPPPVPFIPAPPLYVQPAPYTTGASFDPPVPYGAAPAPRQNVIVIDGVTYFVDP